MKRLQNGYKIPKWKKVKADASFVQNSAFPITRREVVWRLIVEIGIKVHDAIGQEGVIDRVKALEEVLRVAVSNQSSEDLSDIPVAWNRILAGGNVVKVT